VSATAQKERAAEAAAAVVSSGQLLGLGSGSTAALVLEALARRLATGEISDVAGVPTSLETADLAATLGIPLVGLEVNPVLDLAIDGADEVDPELNVIKGRGGALLREKIVACASRRFVVVVDESKLVDRLGVWAPVPVEVLPFGWRFVADQVERLGAAASLRESDGTVVETDQGNYVLDCAFDGMDDPAALARRLASIPGVLGHGLFVAMADEVIVGRDDGVEVLGAADRA
jgi:ribose 5-phosphate isomerase A